MVECVEDLKTDSILVVCEPFSNWDRFSVGVTLFLLLEMHRVG